MTIHPSLDNRPGTSHSKLYMLRCLIAMAHADGVFCAAERSYLNGMFNRIKLTEEQRATLESDFETPQDVFDLLKQINDPAFRSQVIYFARILANKDTTLSVSEEIILDKLKTIMRDGVDIDQIREDVHRVVTKDLAIHDAKMQTIRPTGFTLFGIFDKLCLCLGIDLLATEVDDIPSPRK